MQNLMNKAKDAMGGHHDEQQTSSATYIVTLNGKEVAKSSRTIEVEGNHYFPRDDVHDQDWQESPTQYTCPWKGPAVYYTIDGVVDAAWAYPVVKPKAEYIKNYVAFTKSKVSIAKA